MLTLLSQPASGGAFCDGLSRRRFLTVGGTVCGGLSLASLLQAEQHLGVGTSHKSLINIFLAGGPPHQDMWDMKPDAPAEIRGEFQPISTNVPGIQICELLPELAKIMDKLVVLRSIVGAGGPHYAVQCLTTGTNKSAPSLGAWVSRIEGAAHPAVPPHLSLCYPTQHPPWGEPGGGGFLGSAHGPHRLLVSHQPPKYRYPTPNKAAKTVQELAPNAGHLTLNEMSLDQLQQRRTLLQQLDAFQDQVNDVPSLRGRNEFVKRAWSILSSPRLVDAFDISKEDPKVVERYGPGSLSYNADSAPRVTENFLVARRLVEAGARVVSLNFGRWDWHSQNFAQGRTEFPMLDQAASALVLDLHERGLDKDVTVIIWGEFGRSPKINGIAGRDHWPRVNSALMAGGGMRTGQVIGATDKHAGEVVDRPITFNEVHATLLHNLGIDPHTAVRDSQGRPHYAVAANCRPIAELA